MIVLEEVRPGWWETRRAIYHDIPARVLYRLPQGTSAPARSLAEGVWEEFDRVGLVFNSFDPTSEVGRLNDPVQAGQRSVPISADLFKVLRLSRRLWEASDGCFDPTVWPLKELWREAVRADRPPSEAQLAEALDMMGFQKVGLSETDGHEVDLPPVALRFDFGGIAKGYAVDCVEAFLRRHAVEDALVQLGGEVSAFGDNDGKAWRVGVQHPQDMDALWGVIAATGPVRVSTSGNYRQQLEIAGRTYYHIFDPRDGRPVPTRVLGITTAALGGAAGSALLDGAATAVTVMGGEAGLTFARRLGIEVLILVADDGDTIQEVMTERFRTHFERMAEE
jgi:thiamine biosynthesis lipoprotein